MSLYQTHRPTTLDEVVGNKSIKESLESVLSREDKPHAFLFTGPSGTGKTTFSRIIKDMLECSEEDFYEYNSANTRGIDTIREIAQNCHYSALISKVKVYLLDECFSENTTVSTPKGNVRIKDIQEGDYVFNLEGKRKVKYKFKNKVGLDRVVRVGKSDSSFIYTTKQHLFFTDSGWKEAQYLTKKDLLFFFDHDSMYNNKYLLKEKMRYEREKMSSLFADVYPQIQKQFDMLQQKVCLHKKEQKRNRDSSLRMVWERYGGNTDSKDTKTFLFSELCFSPSTELASHKRDFSFGRASEKNEQFEEKYESFTKGEISEGFFKEDEREQSFFHPQCCRKTNYYEKNKWNAWSEETRRKWNRTFSFRNAFTNSFRKFMGTRSSCKNFSGFSKRKEKASGISYLLQNRCGEFPTEISNRDRWMESFFTWKNRTGSKERNSSEKVRVDSVEVYKRGSNDESFKGVIGDTERNQGFVEFYDLEIDGHPSYYANGVLAHNCHKSTNDAQNALLKLLEDTPKHVYFILCTTEPEKVLKTIHTRCTSYQTKSLSPREMQSLLLTVLKKEGIDVFPDTVIQEIIRVSEGSARQALVVLDSVIDIEDDAKALEAVTAFSVGEVEVLEIFKSLMNSDDWNSIRKKVATVLQNTEPEKIRYAMLGLAGATLLRGVDNRASMLIDIFSENTYNTGKAGLINSFYISCQ